MRRVGDARVEGNGAARRADTGRLPRHIAIIMDGNGRWAQARGLPRVTGHARGMAAVRRIVEACVDLRIAVLTLYAFSLDNWKRPREEVETLMDLLDRYLDQEIEHLNRHGIRFQAIGRLQQLPPRVQEKLAQASRVTRRNTGLILNLALNYGGRAEILDAVRALAAAAKAGQCDPGRISERTFARHLYTRDLPDPDLLIRTSGEMRLSNFLLWQISYCELYITKKLWPDFTRHDLEVALAAYQRRERRFGAAEAVGAV